MHTMKMTRNSLIFAILCLLPAMVAQAIPLPETREEAIKLEAGLRRLEMTRQLQRNESFANGVHTEYLEYQFTVSSLPIDSITMVVTHRVVVDSSAIDQYRFHLADARMLRLQIDGDDRPYQREGDIIAVDLASQVASGGRFDMTVRYKIEVRSPGTYSGMQYSPGQDVLFTNGEPFDTRLWLACWDYPDAKIDTVVSRVTLPDPYKVLSNGELLSNEGTSSARTWVWRSTDPISSYLISIAAHPYAVHHDREAGVNQTPVAYWVYPEDSTDQVYDYGRTPEMIELFEQLFGDYPFNKYDQASAPIFNGGGAMEHQTATTYGSSLVGDGTRRYERIVAHELAHQWWGDYVGPRDFRNIWLNEGFASYSEILWSGSVDSSAMQSLLWTQASRYFSEDGSGARFPLYDPPEGYLFSATVYVKGSRVLHMLRWELGDSLFFKGMREYARTFAYGSATTQEFQQVMEDVSGRSLETFFQQWVYSAGYPIVAFSDITFNGSGNAYWASIRVNQTQLDAPLFEFDLPLEFRSSSGDTTLIVPIDAVREQMLNLGPMPFKPGEIVVDPEDWILLRSNLGTLTEGPLPQLFTLSSVYPNPTNSAVRSRISVHRPGTVEVGVFNLLGQQVAMLQVIRKPGVYLIQWTPDPGTASGMYLLRAASGGEIQTRKLLLVR